jgi:hypothetical protein
VGVLKQSKGKRSLGSTSKNRWLLVIVDDLVSVPPYHQLEPMVVPEVFSVPGFLKQFIGLAYQEGKDIVFRFITQYSSLMDFGPYVIVGLFSNEDF